MWPRSTRQQRNCYPPVTPACPSCQVLHSSTAAVYKQQNNVELSFVPSCVPTRSAQFSTDQDHVEDTLALCSKLQRVCAAATSSRCALTLVQKQSWIAAAPGAQQSPSRLAAAVFLTELSAVPAVAGCILGSVASFEPEAFTQWQGKRW
jgi:hypothetical protein